jgi:2'-5' RNA ligase
MRLFIALDIEENIRERISVFLNEVRGLAGEARWVKPESLHVTLKFVGEKPAEMVTSLKEELRNIRVAPLEVTFRGYGFFPAPKAARVFWVGIQAGPELSHLASLVDEVAFRLGIPREDHTFSPHLTLARRGVRSGAPRWQKGDGSNPGFRKLQEKLAAMPTPEFGSMTARDFCLYQSQLSPGGSRYTRLERFPLSTAEPAQGNHSPKP